MNSFVKSQLRKVNAMLDRWMTKREKQIVLPENVEIILDLPYMDDNLKCHRMDVYRPRNPSGPLPVIVNLHGGGMLLCTKEVNKVFCCELAKRGFLVFCLEYPLVPEADIPTILADISRGMDRVDRILESFGGDRDRVYQVGDSAGAFLTLYAAAAQKNPELAASIPVTPAAIPLRALGLISGMYYTTKPDTVGFFLRKDFYGRNWRKHPMSRFYRADCPGVAGCVPPCFLVTSGSDNLHGYTARLVRGLKAQGTSHKLLDFPLWKNLQHDFVIVTPEKPDAQYAIDEMAQFLLQH